MLKTALCLAGALLAFPVMGEEDDSWKEGFKTISEKDLKAHLLQIASPQFEGRDSPSEGQRRAAEYIIECFKQAGVEPAWDKGYRHAFTVERRSPNPAACRLTVTSGDDVERFDLETDFVPFPFCSGKAEGDLIFLGFGITGHKRYDDLGRRKYKGKIALILSGEPRHKKRFEGPVVTEYSDTYAKVAELQDRGCVGVLVVRRAPVELEDGKGEVLAPTKLGFRHTWGTWNPGTTKGMRRPKQNYKLPVAEVTEAAASRILGQDIVAIAATLDKTVKPKRIEPEGVTVSMEAGATRGEVQLDNIFGIVRGTDPQLSKEYLIIGAHYDHVGVDWWGRVGCGADDNGSGTVAALELVEAFAVSPPRRSLIFAFFSAEEDGLLGSEAFAEELPFLSDERTRSDRPVIAMLNMDMLGRGVDKEVVVLGTMQNPSLGKVLKRAKKFSKTGVKKIITGKAMDLWERSDHHSFHQEDIPVLFFFEAAAIGDNRDYHTFRDTIDGLSLRKIANSAKLVFNTAWLLATDDKRPPAPR